ncbi:hypothetical protein [Actinomadura xylanilytica]|uniref:hypothetical protein n=1 Tax=Actinomadura xylanilytica TaxID=887459 RepID=UPI00255B1EEF|nr:hypothetical protein [Actinomadura xylanilytica]MDL4772640.1 hypothetical protein [Actinomadura xylanilytica]
MTRCTVTTGFFVLGRCGRPSVAACPQCARPVCDEHAAGPNGLCPECAAAQGYGSHDAHDPGWAGGYRRHFYQSTSSTYQDRAWYSSFDSYDRGSFERGGDHSFAEGDFDDDDTGFVDS